MASIASPAAIEPIRGIFIKLKSLSFWFEIFLKFGRPIPTIVISADQSEKMILEASRKGHSILAKPVKPAALRALMTRLLTTTNQQLN